MFLDIYTYRVDEKGRVPLPPKFRREMKDGVILARGPEKCILAYPLAEWKRLANSLAEKAVTAANLRKLNRILFGHASSTSFDGQGRIILPFLLRTYASIEDMAIVVGANTYVEIWNKELWEEVKTHDEEQFSQLIESFGQ